ncbi:MAG: DnaD domain protein [Oscillospiraceae bacterium]
MGRIKENLGMRGRELTATEQKYISSWLDMGFGEECISIAYDRTVTDTGALKWNYMNKILLSWHKGYTQCRPAGGKGGPRQDGAHPY